MVFICVPLSRRAIQLSPLILTLAMFSTPCHCWKGSGFRKGVCAHCSMPWVLPLEALLVWSLLSEGPGIPSSVPSPPCGLMGIHSQCFYRWAVTEKVVQAATVIAAFPFLLGIFHSPHQVHHEFLCDTFNTVGVLTIYFFILLGTLLFHMCQAYIGCLTTGRVPFNFHREKKLVDLALAVLLMVWLWEGSMESSFLASLTAHR